MCFSDLSGLVDALGVVDHRPSLPQHLRPLHLPLVLLKHTITTTTTIVNSSIIIITVILIGIGKNVQRYPLLINPRQAPSYLDDIPGPIVVLEGRLERRLALLAVGHTRVGPSLHQQHADPLIVPPLDCSYQRVGPQLKADKGRQQWRAVG